jgi:hypothetical protein
MYKELMASYSNFYCVGRVTSDLLQAYLRVADIMLFCYQERYQNDQATNSHKLMEYLGSGKVIVSTFTKEYELNHDLIAMTRRNSDLPDVFRTVVNDLSFYNSDTLSGKRVDFAKDNSYEKQIERIENILEGRASQSDG